MVYNNIINELRVDEQTFTKEREKMQIFINGIKATQEDIKALMRNLKNKKDGLRCVIAHENVLHFETV